MLPSEWNAFFSLVLPVVMRGDLEVVEQHLESRLHTFAMPSNGKQYEIDDAELPMGSVAVVVLEGVLYSWETYRLEQQLREIEHNPKLCGVVLWINGPGGMVTNVDVVSDLLRGYSKPTATFVAGMMASAHFWIGTSTQRTVMLSRLNEVGSVGVMLTWMSIKKWLESEGIVLRDIYPNTADLKNLAVRALEDSDDDAPTKEHLERLHLAFAEAVALNLSVKYDPKLPLFRGATFTGEEALKLGYIDQIGTLEDAVRWVLGRATANVVNNAFKKQATSKSHI